MQHPRRLPDGNDRARRPWAALVVLLALIAGSIFGCLNPRPEEDPSSDNGAPSNPAVVDPGVDLDEPATPERESCDDNPLLAGCEPSAPASPGAPATSPPQDGAGPGPADAGVPPAGDAGEPDAGTASGAESSLAQ